MFFAGKYQVIYSNLSSFIIVMLISFSLSVLALIYIPIFDFFSGGSLGLLSFIILSIIPFIAIGVFIGYIFQINNYRSGLIYGFDLFGGASAALASYYLLNALNLINIYAVVLLFLLGAAIILALIVPKINKIFIAVYSLLVIIFLV